MKWSLVQKGKSEKSYETFPRWKFKKRISYKTTLEKVKLKSSGDASPHGLWNPLSRNHCIVETVYVSGKELLLWWVLVQQSSWDVPVLQLVPWFFSMFVDPSLWMAFELLIHMQRFSMTKPFMSRLIVGLVIAYQDSHYWAETLVGMSW